MPLASGVSPPPRDFPERLLKGNAAYCVRLKAGSQRCGDGGIGAATMREFVRCGTLVLIHGVCTGYRATVAPDFEMEKAGFEAGRRIECPTLVLVGGQSHTAAFYNFTEAWLHYAANVVSCVALPSGHNRAEQAPHET